MNRFVSGEFEQARPAPADKSWITFEPAPRSLWSRIRRLWHREGITIQLKDVARLDLKPGDTLVVTLPADATAQEAAQAKERILATLGGRLASDHLLVIPETAKVSVLRIDGHPLAQWELELLARQPCPAPSPADPVE